MISVGIDVSKGKSTVCVLESYGEIVLSPKDYRHTTTELDVLASKLATYDEEIHVIMEVTGSYHLSIAAHLKKAGYLVYIINPLEMKRYRCQRIRNPKTDRIDAFTIAQYGIDFWYRVPVDRSIDKSRSELKFLGTQYLNFMKSRQDRCLALCNIMDRTLPGIYGKIETFNRNTGRDKLCDFVYDYYHRDCIMKYSEQKFCERYQAWTKKKGYRYRENEARQLYRIAKDSIPTLTATENTKMMVREIVTVLRAVNISIYRILSQMQVLAKQMPEYETVMAMKGAGDSIGPRLIAAIGDPRRFHSEKALIAYAGIDAPPYQSGKFTGTERHMSKRESKIMRKLGFELMDSINKHQANYQEDAVCQYFLKKRAEGKAYRVAMFAAYNKFLRIYHSKVSAVLKEYEAMN